MFWVPHNNSILDSERNENAVGSNQVDFMFDFMDQKNRYYFYTRTIVQVENCASRTVTYFNSGVFTGGVCWGF